MKALIKAFVLLLFFNGLLVYVHYQDASDVSAGNWGQTSYDQEIEVTNRADGLYIRHYFTNLPTGRLEINWPKESEQRTCHVEDSGSCLRLNEEATAFVEGEEMTQAISYVIPKNEAVGDMELLQSVFVKLYEASPRATVLHMIDEVHSGGMWITGLQQVGHKTLPLIEYTLYSGSGIVEDLYWQKQRKPIHYSSEHLTVYGNEVTEAFEEFEDVLRQLKAPHMALVLNQRDRSIVKNRFSVTTQDQVNQILKQFAISQYYVNYKAEAVDSFTAEVVTALLLEDEFETLFAQEAIRQLENTLTTSQMERFSEELVKKYGEPMSAEIADELIEEVIGYKTSFFQKNSQSEREIYPLFLENPKEIVVGGSEALEKYAIVQGDRTYYPVKEVMEKIGYDVSWNDQSLYIENVENQYRFPMDAHFYVFNDRRFNTQSIPFQRIEEDFYFEKATMLRIFRLKIEETAEKIIVKPIDLQEEDVK